MKIRFAWILVILCGLVSCDKKAEQKLSQLEIGDRIFDYADLLTPEQENSLFQLIKDLDEEIGSQIAIVTVFSLDGAVDTISLVMASITPGKKTKSLSTKMT